MQKDVVTDRPDQQAGGNREIKTKSQTGRQTAIPTDKNIKHTHSRVYCLILCASQLIKGFNAVNALARCRTPGRNQRN